MKNESKWPKRIPLIAFALTLCGVAAAAMAPGKIRGFDVEGFGSLPVLEGGRIKPIDSVGRNSLLMIRSQQSFNGVSASEWMLDVLFRPAIADAQPIFVINDPDVLGLIGLKQTSDRYFSFKTLMPHLQEIEKQGKAAHMIESKQRTRFQGAIVNLFDRLFLYYKLKNTVQLEKIPLGNELADLRGEGAAERHDALSQLAQFRPLPPNPADPKAGWKNTGEALQAGADPALETMARLAASYAAGDAADFNKIVSELHGLVQASAAADQSRADGEIIFNRIQPFYLGMVIYVLALLVLFAGWAWKPEVLQPTAFWLMGAGYLVHTGGLIARIALQGRPPVTNLYSSAVFVGWAAVLLGLILERLYRRGFGTAVAGAAGFASLIVAHHLAGDGDTMEMMRAVLDSNFWLATHVVSITIGYSGTFLAGTIAIAYTIRRHLARTIDPATTKVLVSMAYGVISFALFFSFLGTVLGGIWADQSWGRFWGWDPKENGALLIVLWNAIILHSRLGGFIREKGLMAMAIFGNIITSLSWFGVNMLGVGLHSYGFMDKAFYSLSGFIASQLVLMTICLLPRQFWKGRAAQTNEAGGKSPPKVESAPA